MKKVFSIHPITGAYQGEVYLDESDVSPLEPGVYLIPAGCVEVPPPSYTENQFAQWLDGKWLVKDAPLKPSDPEQAPPTVDELIARFTSAIQQRLDEFARSRHYDNILSACTYATSTVPKFKSEGQACVNLRDATWAAAYDILAKVQAGQRPMPNSIADIEADLPAAVWPA